MIREDIDWRTASQEYVGSTPFQHLVIDDFWREDVAEALHAEFPEYNSTVWNAHYNNKIENKKGCNHWDKFPAATYKAFNYLNNPEFIQLVKQATFHYDIEMDVGLHGGGWHAHTNGGNLNMHLDYNIHPKMGMQRRLNIIIYLTKDWDAAYGGGLELWSHNEETNQPKEHVKTIDIKFNRAVLFNTTQNSWHGLPYPLSCPDHMVRQSMAAYYMGPAPEDTPNRLRALFAPRLDQVGNTEIEELIKQRSNIQTAKYT